MTFWKFFERQGDVIKVRGGARSMKYITTSMEENIVTRSGENTLSKQKIANAASAYIETGRSIFFDSGSTVMQMAHLMPKTRLTVNTTDPNLALELVKQENMYKSTWKVYIFMLKYLQEMSWVLWIK